MNLKMGYRPDIDGLRAIAVLSVLFYHLDISIFSGGYVGVDVFFVISGYLITGIIVREIEIAEFSILKFYERRIRRIFPALYPVIIFVLLVTAWLYDSHSFMEVGKSVAATVVFSSNVLFWSQSGYFSAQSTLKPMLHAWSLAVEEQFYIALPLLIWLVMRFARSRLKFTLAALALLSFGLSIYYTKFDSSAAFYFAHLRAWEFLMGGLLAVNALPSTSNARFRNALLLVGIAMIMTSVFLYTYRTLFPGMNALLPTLGAALIIYGGAGGDSIAVNVLKTPTFVFLGKISYSLYLWHWPIIVFGKTYLITPPTVMDKVGWIAASFVIATLSWKFIENPFRSNSYFLRPKIFIFAGSAMAVALAASAVIYFKDGLPERFHGSPQLIANLGVSLEWENRPQCETSANWPTDTLMARINLCPLGSSTEPSFIVWGDSHAAAIAPAINSSAQKLGKAGYMTMLYGCLPLIGVDTPGIQGCFEYNNSVLKYIQKNPNIKTVILAGRWALATHSTYESEKYGSLILADMTKNSTTTNGDDAIFESGLTRTVKRLLDLDCRVILVMQAPEIQYNVPSSYFVAVRTGRDLNLFAQTYDEYVKKSRSVFDFFNSLKDGERVRIISLPGVLCTAEICPVVMEGQLLYTDNNHLSVFGSQYVSSAFDPVLNDMP